MINPWLTMKRVATAAARVATLGAGETEVSAANGMNTIAAAVSRDIHDRRRLPNKNRALSGCPASLATASNPRHTSAAEVIRKTKSDGIVEAL